MPPEVVDNGTPSTPASAPTSAVQAMERASAGSSPASTPTAPVGTPPASGATSVTPPAAATTVPPTPAVTPPADAPEARIESAVKNARSKMGEAYGIAGMAPETVKGAVSLQQEIGKDAKAFALKLCGELGIQVVQHGLPPPAQEEDYPEGDLIAPDGRKVHSDASFRKALAVQERRLMKQFESGIKPFQDAQQAATEERASLQRTRENDQYAAEVVADLETLPHFKDHKSEIEQRLRQMAQDEPDRVRRMGSVAALQYCYNKVLAEKVFPGIDTAAEQRVREANAKKAATSRGSAHPADQGGDGKPPALREGDVGGLARHMERLANTT